MLPYREEEIVSSYIEKNLIRTLKRSITCNLLMKKVDMKLACNILMKTEFRTLKSRTLKRFITCNLLKKKKLI